LISKGIAAPAFDFRLISQRASFLRRADSISVATSPV
jgi:hypothetical protein